MFLQDSLKCFFFSMDIDSGGVGFTKTKDSELDKGAMTLAQIGISKLVLNARSS